MLPAKYRLKNKEAFNAVFQKGKTVSNEVLIMKFRPGSDKETKMKDLAEKINSLVRNKAGITFIERREWDSIFRRVPSCKKAKRIIDYKEIIFSARMLIILQQFIDNNRYCS